MRGVHWFRNDLRLRDNTALADAASACDELALLFVLDDALLAHAGPPRRRFLLGAIERLAADAMRSGQRLLVRHGDPRRVVPRVLEEARAGRLFHNRDTTPVARARDDAVRRAAERLGVRVETRTDRVIFEATDVRTRLGGAYSVYSPFARTWMERLADEPQPPERAPRLPPPIQGLHSDRLPPPIQGLHSDRLPPPIQGLHSDLLPPPDAGAAPTPGSRAGRSRLRAFLDDGLGRYAEQRDFPAADATSRLSPYLRFGCVSIRDCVYGARDAARADRRLAIGARKWIDELVWREFYASVLEEHPANLRRPQRREFERVAWIDDDAEFAAWCEGRTGYPIVDAGMRELRQTGTVHNRVRMIVASFLTKDLLVDWRRGERFFFEWLVDGDPASNNGGWQWAASTGTDPQPTFRIFNPTLQAKRFDPDGAYVRRYVPELRRVADAHVHEPWRAGPERGGYPDPIVSHAERRLEALARYDAARSGARGGC